MDFTKNSISPNQIDDYVVANRNYLKTISSLKTILILTVKTNTSHKLQFSQKEICRKYYRIDPDPIQRAGNLALSYSLSYKFPKPEISVFT